MTYLKKVVTNNVYDAHLQISHRIKARDPSIKLLPTPPPTFKPEILKPSKVEELPRTIGQIEIELNNVAETRNIRAIPHEIGKIVEKYELRADTRNLLLAIATLQERSARQAKNKKALN